MFDKYIIVEDTLRNVMAGDDITGFQLGVRLPYYRGLGLSMVEDVQVTVDGETAPAESVSLMVHGNTYKLADLPDVFDDRWEMGEVATISVEKPGGLAGGEHEVAVRERLRISYMPVPGGGADQKMLTLRE
ncbi:C-glycoside deglycosidase beta subunit domain-containing protein [Paenarthrobacter nitroguajacolicus]|uniref:C-glycoside deglycosidase beta subunit domain-containing protein n=1 Tax=Paenarthrobacter nitroguajacolicus TaxID=211146 RepID=UPI0015BD78CB|nr:DUF6379 domain-containing protein [Paenarthrobacter nitroguajacolicus]NWL32703.1 hypothetical protein [Paenarthrobacter nitroguajacolicus]